MRPYALDSARFPLLDTSSGIFASGYDCANRFCCLMSHVSSLLYNSLEKLGIVWEVTPVHGRFLETHQASANSDRFATLHIWHENLIFFSRDSSTLWIR